MRIDHVMFRTTDLDGSISFYHDVFGLELISVDNRMGNDVKYITAFMGVDGPQGFKIELTFNPEELNLSPGNTVDHLAIYVDDSGKIHNALAGIVDFEVTKHQYGDKTYTFTKFKSPEGINLVAIEKVVL